MSTANMSRTKRSKLGQQTPSPSNSNRKKSPKSNDARNKTNNKNKNKNKNMNREDSPSFNSAKSHSKSYSKSVSKSQSKSKSPSTELREETANHWKETINTRLYAERRYLDPLEQAVPFFYTTHSILALLVAIAPTIVIAFFYPPQTVSDATTRIMYLGLWYYLIIGTMIFPSGPFIRPHPTFWRIIFAISLLYLFILLVILLLPNDYVRETFIPFIFQDNTLGVPLQLPDYAADCSLTMDNVLSKMDRFVFAHFWGWFFKAILIRHRFLLWSLSLIWELIELSLVYVIPNFGECWWDSYILDFLICNGLGIEIGLMFCQWWTNYQTYHWSPLLNSSKIYDKIKNYIKGFFVITLTPKKWRKTAWEPYNSNKRFLQVHLIMFFMCFIDLNAFLLKLYLWIPTEHKFNIIRVVLYWFVCMPAIRQYYFYVTDPNIKRMGSQVWVLIMLVVLEICIVIKFTPHDNPRAPLPNVLAWTVAAMMYMGWNYVMCTDVLPLPSSLRRKKRKNNNNKKD